MRIEKLIPAAVSAVFVLSSCQAVKSAVDTPETAVQDTPEVIQVTEEVMQDFTLPEIQPPTEEFTQSETMGRTDDEEKDSLEKECHELKTKLEDAYTQMQWDGVYFNDNIKDYMTYNNISSEQISRIQSLVFSRETWQVVYLTLSEREIPYGSSVTYETDDRYYKDGTEISDISEIDKAVDIEKYTSELSGNYVVYLGSTDEYINYRIREDMNAEQLLMTLADAMSYLDIRSEVINSLWNEDVFRLNIYELWSYIPSSAGRAAKSAQQEDYQEAEEYEDYADYQDYEYYYYDYYQEY